MTGAVALRRAGWWHPEAAAAGVAAAAWALLLVPAAAGEAVHHAHAHVHAAAPWLAGATGWLLMVAAMMLPAVLPAARRLALASLWDRRRRTVALFLGAYLCVWAAFGAIALPAAAWARGALGADAAVAAALAIAALWELGPWKWRALRACHLIAPLPPRGARADAACAAAGLRYGRRCVAACWGAMLAMAVAGHGGLALMGLLTAVVIVEKRTVRAARLGPPAAALLLGAALLYAV